MNTAPDLADLAAQIAEMPDDDHLTYLHGKLSHHEAMASLYVAEIRRRQAEQDEES